MARLTKIDWVATFLICGLILLLIQSGSRGNTSIFDYYQLKASYKNLEQTNEHLDAEIKSLSQKINLLKNSPDYTKHVLKERYNYQPKSETVIYFSNQY